MVRCPVCDATAVTIVLNSKPRASCASCGARWIQEGSWQRSIQPGQVNLPLHAATGNGNGHETPDEVIPLPDSVRRRPSRRVRPADPEQAIAN